MKPFVQKTIIFSFLIAISLSSYAQVAINDNGNTANPNAILDVDVSSNDMGILIPRLTSAERNAMTLGASENGLTVYDETVNRFYFWDGSQWSEITIQGANWSILGNSGIDSANNFLGTIDSQDIAFRTNNTERARFLSSGQLGINTRTPDVYLHIYGDDGTTVTDDATYASGTGLMVLGNISERNLVFDQNEILARNNGGPSSLYLQNRGGDIRVHYDRPITTHDDGTQFIIKDDGKVGIGFLSPKDMLHIYGTLPYLRFTDKDGGHDWNIGVNGGNNRFQIGEDDGTTYFPHRFVIKEGGFVGIGTVNPEGLLHIKADAGNDADFYIDANAGNDATDTWIIQSAQTDNDLNFINNVTTNVTFKSSGNVGIGTSSPEGRLHICASSGNNATFVIDADAGADATDTWKIRSVASNNNLNFINDNSTLMSIESGGNVGIGTDNPDAKLHVVYSGTTMSQYAGTVAAFQQNNATTDWARISIIGGTAGASVIDFGDKDKQDIGMLKYDHTDNYLSYSYNNSEIMRVEDYGYVGIGQTNPSEVLDVNGAVRIGNTSNTNAGTIRWNGSNFQGYDGSTWKALDVQTTSGGGWTDGGTAVYLTTSSDNVGIGTTDPSGMLDIYQNVSDAHLIHLENDARMYSIKVSDAGTGDDNLAFGDETAGITRMVISKDGNVGIGINLPSEKLEVDGNIKTSGNVQVGTEVNRAAQGTADLIPIAYGVVNSNGTIANAGTGNWSVTSSSTGRYDISITSETYSSDNYMTQITPRYLSTGTTSNYVRIATFGDSGGDLRIYLKDGDGDFKNTTFHFIVYKP